MRERADKSRCQTANSIKQMPVNGIITLKFRDKRKLRYINFSNKNVIYKTNFFVLDGSDTFDQLHIGDSISKEADSYEVKVYRNDSMFTNSLNYACE